MVCLDEMLQCARLFLGVRFDIMSFIDRDVDSRSSTIGISKETAEG